MENNNEDSFYRELGLAISQWSAVERGVYLIYEEIMKPQIWVVVSSTYHVSQVFRQKLAIVDIAIKSAYNNTEHYKDLHKEWKSLKARISKNSTKRNDIAHLSTFHDIDGICLRPELMNAKAMLEQSYKSKTYRLKNLEQCTKDFYMLVNDIDVFVARMPPPPLSPLRRSRPKKDR